MSTAMTVLGVLAKIGDAFCTGLLVQAKLNNPPQYKQMVKDRWELLNSIHGVWSPRHEEFRAFLNSLPQTDWELMERLTVFAARPARCVSTRAPSRRPQTLRAQPPRQLKAAPPAPVKFDPAALAREFEAHYLSEHPNAKTEEIAKVFKRALAGKPPAKGRRESPLSEAVKKHCAEHPAATLDEVADVTYRVTYPKYEPTESRIKSHREKVYYIFRKIKGS